MREPEARVLAILPPFSRGCKPVLVAQHRARQAQEKRDANVEGMAVRENHFLLDRGDGGKIQVYRWSGDGAPRAVVQISHGLAEHAGRYARLAEALTGAGYGVYASDHRGHGPSAAAQDLGHFADADGWRKCVDDLWAVNRHIAAETPHARIVLLAHSMGSWLGQQFISEHGDSLVAAALSGSNGAPPPIAEILRLIARVERWRLGGRGQSALLQKMMFEDLNKPFKPSRTDLDWLSRDAKEVDKYVADPLCGFPVSTQLAIDLLDALKPLTAPATIARIPKALPIYIFSGERDSVGPNLKGLIAAYRAAGLNVRTKIYPEARHETLNEINRDEVTADLLAWINEQTTQPGARGRRVWLES
jgi:alpha-beta hydrolase superfamily lysophospholipase